MTPTQRFSQVLLCLWLCANSLGTAWAQEATDTLQWTGKVFVDHNGNDRFDGLDYGHPVLRINAYADWNGNGVQDEADTLLVQASSDRNGRFALQWVAPVEAASPEAYLLGVNEEDLNEQARDRHRLHPMTSSQEALLLGIQAVPGWCYAIGDGSSPDQLMMVNINSGHQLPVPGDLETRYVEAMAVSPGGRSMFAVNKEKVGKVSFANGRFEPLSDTLGMGLGSEGMHAFEDIDALAFDPFSGTLFAAERRSFKRDLLVQIDTTTGKIIKHAFGPGMDYVVMEGEGVQAEIDGLAVDPASGKLYGINNFSNVTHYDLLVEINKQTGATRIIDTLKVEGAYLHDAEGLGFTNEGTLFATTGTSAAASHENTAFSINLTTAEAQPLASFNFSNDYESCDCMNAAANILTGKVFEDLNGNQQQDPNEQGLAGLNLYIFMDNGDRKVGRGDVLLDSVQTNAHGMYRWKAAANVDVVVEVDMKGLPTGFEHVGAHHQVALFSKSFGGMEDGQNNFGIAHGNYLREWMAFSQTRNRASRDEIQPLSRGGDLLATADQNDSRAKAVKSMDLTPFPFATAPVVLTRNLPLVADEEPEAPKQPIRISMNEMDRTFFRMKQGNQAAADYLEHEWPSLLGTAMSARLLKSFATKTTITLPADLAPKGTYHFQVFNHESNFMLRVKVK